MNGGLTGYSVLGDVFTGIAEIGLPKKNAKKPKTKYRMLCTVGTVADNFRT
jgi:hypothetical protein